LELAVTNMKSNPASLVPPWNARRVFEATLVVIGVCLGFWLLYVGRIALFSLFTAIVISTAIAPAVDWMRRRGMPAGAGVVLIYLALIAGLSGVGLLVVPLLTVQGAHIISTFGHLYARLIAFLGQSPSYLLHRLVSGLPPTLALAAPPTAGQPATLAALLGGLAYLGLVGDGLFALVSVMLLAFYWTLERDRVLLWLLLLPAAGRNQARDLITASEQKVGGYIRGVALLSRMVVLLAFGAYLLMGLPFALLLAILAGLLEAVPVIGPALGTIPAIIVALAVAPDKIVWVVLTHALIQVLENYVLAPRVMRHTVGVNPVVTLLSLLAFGGLLGLPGALMAIPIAAVAQLLLDHFVLRPEAVMTRAPSGRDSLSVVRYDARELVHDVRNQWRDQAKRRPGCRPMASTRSKKRWRRWLPTWTTCWPTRPMPSREWTHHETPGDLDRYGRGHPGRRLAAVAVSLGTAALPVVFRAGGRAAPAGGWAGARLALAAPGRLADRVWAHPGLHDRGDCGDLWSAVGRLAPVG
jgi:predicted PurR-regulated permease PerM